MRYCNTGIIEEKNSKRKLMSLSALKNPLPSPHRLICTFRNTATQTCTDPMFANKCGDLIRGYLSINSFSTTFLSPLDLVQNLAFHLQPFVLFYFCRSRPRRQIQNVSVNFTVDLLQEPPCF